MKLSPWVVVRRVLLGIAGEAIFRAFIVLEAGNSEAGAATFYASARGEKGMQRDVAFIDHLRDYTKAYKSAVAMFVRSL